jgi:hypothetical protein
LEWSSPVHPNQFSKTASSRGRPWASGLTGPPHALGEGADHLLQEGLLQRLLRLEVLEYAALRQAGGAPDVAQAHGGQAPHAGLLGRGLQDSLTRVVAFGHNPPG